MTRTVRFALIGGTALLLLAALTSSDESSYGDSYDDEGYSQNGEAQGGSMQGGSMQGGSMQDGSLQDGSLQDGSLQDGSGFFGGGASGGVAGATAGDAGDAGMDAYHARDAASDETQRRFLNQINGTADVYDAESGTTTRGLDNSADSYWTNPTTGDAIGTDAYSDNPDPSSYNSTTNLDDM